MVRRIKCSRAWTKTCTETSFGINFFSINSRVKANSVSEAEGNPISISLKPISHNILNISNFSETFIGIAKAWLPSRKSTEHQRGAWVIDASGHWRFSKRTVWKGRYLEPGFCIHQMCWMKDEKKGRARRAWVLVLKQKSPLGMSRRAFRKRVRPGLKLLVWS